LAVVHPVAAAPGERRRLRLASPATLEPIGEVEVQGAADVTAALERARKAQSDWGALSFEQRSRSLRRAVRVLLDRQDAFLEVLVRETGKPETEVLAVELLGSCDALEFYAKNSGPMLADRTVPVHLVKAKKLRISYRPLGVVGIITPWNFPFLLSLNPSVQALMAGNAVLLKPSEATPHSGLLLQQLFEAAGLPEGVFQVLCGDGETGAALVESGVDKISFTGSVATGRRVAEACARRLVPCTLELGGKDPMIVCGDADLARAARGAVFGAFANAGQVCVSTERVYVVDEVAEEFTRLVVEETSRLRQGPEGEFDVGPMIWPSQLEIVERHVEEAVSQGARILAGGRRNPAYEGFYFEPTVLVDVNHDMRVMREETFGRVLPIMRVRDENEALALANDTSYGLNGSVWTRDRKRGLELAKAVHAGSIVINDCMTTYGVTEAPFGGRKQSGIGQVNGEIGLKSYCHAQSILIHRFGTRSEFLWFPYSLRKARTVRRLMRFIWGTPLGRLLS
jgi:acyl-CoA reductase-like NAD-dependent aldehyde dehydrogenase